MLGDLSKNYEVGYYGTCGTISSGDGDSGGKSYGLYQLSSASGTLNDFIDWLQDKNTDIYTRLNECKSKDFDTEWKAIADEYCDDFCQLQHDYIKDTIYNTAVTYLKENYFDLNNHYETMKDVVWSRAVQYGAGNIVEMFEEAAEALGYPNLSYVDDKNFDIDMIESIYLNICKSEEWTSGAPSLREGLYSRFNNECKDALDEIHYEIKSE